jgi:NAD+ diphosphatase
LRTNQSTLDSLWQKAKIAHIADGRIAAIDEKLTFLSASAISDIASTGKFNEGSRYFLGLDAISREPYFAWDTQWVGDVSDEVKSVGFTTLREVGAQLPEIEFELALHATALSNWHRAHPRCPRCGGATRVDLGGAARFCDADQSQHHPRTDSAVIVLIKDRADRILLGHQPVWPEGRFSTFAGFLEPGETFEQCVSREVFEESNITVSEIKYLGSQPWPFPASIMIAFEAVTDNPDVAKGDGEEITEVKWFSRAELKAAAQDGSLLLPPAISVARKMIEGWLGEAAVGGETWR